MNISKQIDFVSHDEESHKWVQNPTNEIANIRQPYQNRMVDAALRLKLNNNHYNNNNKIIVNIILKN